jgi:hypothetical protein
MAIPPAPFIIRESVPAAGCNTAENSSVLSERYLKQKDSRWFQIKHALRVFTAYSKRFRTACIAQIQTLPAWMYPFHISFQPGYRSDALSVSSHKYRLFLPGCILFTFHSNQATGQMLFLFRLTNGETNRLLAWSINKRIYKQSVTETFMTANKKTNWNATC